MKKSRSKKKSISMAELFKDLPRGYWRNVTGKTLALKDLDTEYLQNIRTFLLDKRVSADLLRGLCASQNLRPKNKIPFDLQYIIKIIEVNVELKSRGL